MQIIPLHDTNDVSMTSTIAEPDLTQGEVEWDKNRPNVFPTGINADLAITAFDDTVYLLSTDDYIFSYEIDGAPITSFSVISPCYSITNDGIDILMLQEGITTEGIVYRYGTDGTAKGSITITPANGSVNNSSSIFYKDGFLFLSIDSTKEISTFDAVSGVFVGSYSVSWLGDDRVSSITHNGVSFYLLGSNNGNSSAYSVGDDFSLIKKESERMLIAGYYVSDIVFLDNRFWARNGSSALDFFGFFTSNWLQIGAYITGEQAIKTSTHKLYQAATDTTDDPEVGVTLTPPTWTEVSATNKYRAFDYVRDAQATGVSPLIYTFTPLQVTSAIAWFNVEGADNVNVTVTDPTAGEIYNIDVEMIDPTGVVNMWQYFTYQLAAISGYALDDLPLLYPMAVIQITFTGAGDIKVGEIAYGRGRDAGEVVAGTSTDRRSNSVVKKDSFGGETIVKRPSSTYTTFAVSAPAGAARYLDDLLKSVLDIPTLFIGDGVDGEKIVDLGYYENSPLVRDNPSLSRYNIKVRGLT